MAEALGVQTEVELHAPSHQPPAEETDVEDFLELLERASHLFVIDSKSAWTQGKL